MIDLFREETCLDMKPLKVRLGLMISIIYVFLWMMRKPSSFTVDNYLTQFYSISKFVMILIGVYSLGRDFKEGAYKYTFANGVSIKRIILGRLMGLVGMGFLLWLLHVSLTVIIQMWLFGSMPEASIFIWKAASTFIIYLLTMLLIGCFSILVTSLTLKYNTTMVSTLFIFGIVQFYAPLFILNAHKIIDMPILLSIFNYFPTYIIFYWMETFTVNLLQVIIILICSMLFVISSVFLLEKKDIIQ